MSTMINTPVPYPMPLEHCVTMLRDRAGGHPIRCPCCGSIHFYWTEQGKESSRYYCADYGHVYTLRNETRDKAQAIVDADVPVSSKSEPVEVVPALQFRRELIGVEGNALSKTAACSVCCKRWLKVYRSDQWCGLFDSVLWDTDSIIRHVQSHLS